nr:HD domain-containing protein [Solirubrobacterales bacterium]
MFNDKHSSKILLALVAILLLVTTGYLVVLAATGYDLIDFNALDGPGIGIADERRALLPYALAALVAAILAIGLWVRDRRVEGADSASSSELQRALRSRDTSRAFARRLSTQVDELRSEVGMLGGAENLPELILQLSLELVNADRGAIFKRKGAGSEPRQLVTALGFDGDPRHSAIVNRFAVQAMDRDAIVCHGRDVLEEHRESSVDEEIENVTAIPIFVRDELDGVVVCANSETFGSHDEDVLIALGDQAGAVLKNADLHGELRDSYVATVRMLAEAIRVKDPHLGSHSEDVSGYVGRVAEGLGLDPKRREELVCASLLHDIGKIGISERILLKPGRLNAEEFGVIQLHPRIGSRLVQQVPSLAPLATFILHHHERYDGSGYPAGLKGEEIPLGARVIGVADAFSAMTSDRPYRGRMSLEEACEELERHAGTQFDPDVVRIFADEARLRPPSESEAEPGLGSVLDDPEFQARRPEGEALLGGPRDLTDHLTLLYTHRYFHEVVG